ncbi:hypothetical protein DEAC_c08670 [Desulfosporosinus acididurans]|uniref:DUF5317 domain-containing protein n=1 Tax=Desulfosporosinus acididurans TaxID=476652 RepID=A0A0J1FVC5_9FIRM|nr:DUF5317 domain-containing protein [Desulfosporosinus acididurans]KLU66933.1 hypothetical protein DEAC_c08670 [Desulfosporosinus acididurans]
MLIETLILSLIVSLLCGGELNRLGELALRQFWFVPMAFLLQGVVYWASLRHSGLVPGQLCSLLDTGSYFLLLIFTLRNRSLKGIWLIAGGVFLNTLVIALNGGVMPVDPLFLPETSRKALLAGQGTHGLMTAATHLKILADRFYLAVPGLQKQVFSIGDCLIDIGCFTLIFKTTRRSANKQEKQTA